MGNIIFNERRKKFCIFILDLFMSFKKTYAIMRVLIQMISLFSVLNRGIFHFKNNSGVLINEERVMLTQAVGGKSFPRLQFNALKIQIRSWMHPLLTRKWLKLLNNNKTLQSLWISQPRIIHKVYRPWFSRHLTHAQRLAAIASHYVFISRQQLDDLILAAALHPVELVSFNGKSGNQYCLTLSAVTALEREGELVLQLRAHSLIIYSIAFSFIKICGSEYVGVGCIQGPQSTNGLYLVRETTRDFFGLRPQNLMVRIVCSLGHANGFSHMVLVGNKNRAAPSQSFRKGLVKADYDRLWGELGAYRRPDGNYHLGCNALQQPEVESVPSKKRSATRKRYELLANISLTLINAFGEIKICR